MSEPIDAEQAVKLIAAGKQNERAYLINLKQTLLLCMYADTRVAADVRRDMVEIIDAWLNGEMLPQDQAPTLLKVLGNFAAPAAAEAQTGGVTMGWRKDKLGRWRYSHRCDACRRSFSKVRIAPMLHDGVWLQIADEREHLCEPCARQRAKYHLGRDITMADLTPVEFNFAVPALEHGHLGARQHDTRDRSRMGCRDRQGST